MSRMQNNETSMTLIRNITNILWKNDKSLDAKEAEMIWKTSLWKQELKNLNLCNELDEWKKQH